VFLLAQAGVPFTSGFLAKFYVISAAVDRGSYALAVVAMLAAVVAAFFYLRLIVIMYMGEEPLAGTVADETSPATASGAGSAVATQPQTTTADAALIDVPRGAAIAIGLALAFTVIAGVVPEPFLDFARHATLLRP
jgi:NADH-quinone oxidoreductase subunit N